MLKNLAERQNQVPSITKMLVSWQFFFDCFPGTGKQTERFISNGSEGTLYANTSSYFVDYFYGDNVSRKLIME